jgi:hypothetical protein
MSNKLTSEQLYERDVKKLQESYYQQQSQNPAQFIKNVAEAMAYQYQLVREYKQLMLDMADRKSPRP